MENDNKLVKLKRAVEDAEIAHRRATEDLQAVQDRKLAIFRKTLESNSQDTQEGRHKKDTLTKYEMAKSALDNYWPSEEHAQTD